MTASELRHRAALDAPGSVSRRLVELACLAPSVHNTQPWTWEVDGARVRLYADRARQLRAEDPSGRNLTISCGAALHHLWFAARALGWDAVVDLLPDPSRPDLFADVRLLRAHLPATPAEDLAALRVRCTDRRRFTSWPVPDVLLDSLAENAREWGALAISVTAPAARFRLEVLAGRARLIHQANPAAVREQEQWVERGAADGVPLEVLPAAEVDLAERSRFGPGLVSETREVVESGDGVIALGGADDSQKAWLRTGEGLSALWLRATQAGLSVVPLSLPVEIDGAREELREVVLQGTFAPHLLVRIGWQAIGRTELPRTPRRPMAEVLRATGRGAGRNP